LYWLNIFLLGVIIYIHWSYVVRHKYLVTNIPMEAIDKAIRKRVIVAQSLYAVGALLSFINTYVSIFFIIAVQLHLISEASIPYVFLYINFICYTSSWLSQLQHEMDYWCLLPKPWSTTLTITRLWFVNGFWFSSSFLLREVQPSSSGSCV